MSQTVYERFRETTRNHRMKILNDDGMYRHIRFGSDSVHHSYYITTVPGTLMISGDMGTFTFSRLPDMFDFFRSPFDENGPRISYGYWAEKCTSVDYHASIWEYDSDSLIESAKEYLEEAIEYYGEERKEEIREEFEMDCECYLHDDLGTALNALMDFSVHDGDYKYESPFNNFYEGGDFHKMSFRFKWICVAIASAVRDYDRGGDKNTLQDNETGLILRGKL